MRELRFIIISVLCMNLLGCSPVYRTTYTFQPPETENGRYCANRCLSKMQDCYHQCENISAQCESRKEIANLADVIIESWEKGKVEDGTKASRHYRPRNTNCKNKEAECMARCDQIHRLCHENCGGIVKSQTYCVQNCDKAK